MNIRNPHEHDFGYGSWDDAYGEKYKVYNSDNDVVFAANNLEYANTYLNDNSEDEEARIEEDPYTETIDDLARYVRKGYIGENCDGVYVENIYDGGSDMRITDEYIVFSPNQIKSATDNIGTFSPEDDDIRFRNSADELERVNRRFNEELSSLTEENANSVRLDLGFPSEMLLSAGIEHKPLILYGNKLIKKAKNHGFDIKDVTNLPFALNKPIAVFSGSHTDSFAILTEIMINGNNTLVTVETDKKGEVDINLVSSVFGKGNKGVVKWILDGKLKNVNKEKAQSYISASALIADATYKNELSSAAKIVENFENPTVAKEKPSEEAVGADTTTTGKRDAVDRMAEALNVKVEYVTTGQMEEAGERYGKGYQQGGRIYICLENNRDAEDAATTLIHEAVGHKGLRKVVGAANMDRFCTPVQECHGRGAERDRRARVEARHEFHGGGGGVSCISLGEDRLHRGRKDVLPQGR